MKTLKSAWFLLLAGLLPVVSSGFAQGTIWSGSTIVFTNNSISDVDKLTPEVWLTRDTRGGLFNIAPTMEITYQRGVSPAGTTWALGKLSNYATLVYTDWATCYGGGGNLINNIFGKDTVVHLVQSDIYLAVRFTQFSSGGGFAYVRSTPLNVPEPSASALAIAGLVLMAALRIFSPTKAVKFICRG
jgi:hypothetical protein